MVCPICIENDIKGTDRFKDGSHLPSTSVSVFLSQNIKAQICSAVSRGSISDNSVKHKTVTYPGINIHHFHNGQLFQWKNFSMWDNDLLLRRRYFSLQHELWLFKCISWLKYLTYSYLPNVGCHVHAVTNIWVKQSTFSFKANVAWNNKYMFVAATVTTWLWTKIVFLCE